MPKPRGIPRTLQQGVRGNYYVSLPADVVRLLGWDKGDVVEWRVAGEGELLLKRARQQGEMGDKDPA